MVTELLSAKAIEKAIKVFVRDSKENLLGIDGGPIWEEPLVGFADGDDPLFAEYKKIIGPYHLTPREFLEEAAGDSPRPTPAKKVSVICWVLPMASRIRAGNRKREAAPTVRWVYGMTHGELFNNSLRRHVADLLTREGHLAVAPVRTAKYKSFNLPEGRTSNWSERHALYAAGMGTFGLNDGFITAKGMTMRCGSVVTTLEMPPTPRPYKSHVENCPFLVDGSCGDCIDRCPAGAITAGGHDRNKCEQYKNEVLPELCKSYGRTSQLPRYQEKGKSDPIGCALCMCGVPCESRIPFRKAAAKEMSIP